MTQSNGRVRLKRERKDKQKSYCTSSTKEEHTKRTQDRVCVAKTLTNQKGITKRTGIQQTPRESATRNTLSVIEKRDIHSRHKHTRRLLRHNTVYTEKALTVYI